MADTLNYTWTKPTVGGDTGAWGTILNTLFDDADADLKTVEHIAVKDLAATNDMLIIPGGGFGEGWVGGPTGARENVLTTNPSGFSAIQQLPLRVGQKITAFSTFGWTDGSRTCQVSLHYMDAAGAEITVSAGHALATGGVSTLVSTSGLTHDVATARGYYLKFLPAGGVGVGGSTRINYVRVTVVTA